MEFCAGGDLSRFIHTRRILPEKVARVFMQQLGKSLRPRLPVVCLPATPLPRLRAPALLAGASFPAWVCRALSSPRASPRLKDVVRDTEAVALIWEKSRPQWLVPKCFVKRKSRSLKVWGIQGGF